MAGRSNNLRVQVDIDSRVTGQESFKSAEASAKAMAREMDRVDAAVRAMAAAEAAAYREADAAAAAHEAQVRKMAQAELAAYRDAERAAESQRAAQRAMAQQEAAAYREGEQMASRRETAARRMAAAEAAAYAEVARAAEEAAAARAEADESQLDAMEEVGTATGAVTAAAVVGLGLATKAAMDWESAWAGVTKTVDGSPEQMADLEGSLRQLASTLPSTHEEIAGVAEAAGQLGVKRDDVASFTKVMIDLGETTNLTSDEAATGLAKLMNVMQTAPEDVDRLGATLVALGNDGASTEADVLSMAQRISGAGKLVGASESDVLALANALSSVGVEAELGGGVTTRVMQKIYSAVKEGGDGLSAFAEVAGMSSQEFASAWQSSPVAALDAVFQGLGRVNASGGNTVETLANLGLKGTEEASVLLRMAGAGDLLTRSLDLGNRAWAENAALTEEANKRYQTTEARLQIAQNKINDTAIDIGGNLLPALAEGADFAGDLASAFGGLSQGQQTFVTALGAGAVGITGLVSTAAVAIPKITELRTTLDNLAGGSSRVGRGLSSALGVLTGPWGLALAGATVALGVWAAKQGEARQYVQSLTGEIDAQTGAVSENARAIVAARLAEKGMFGGDSAYDRAEKLGVDLQLVTDAALGSADAMERFRAATAHGAVDDLGMTRLADGTKVASSEVLDLISAVQGSSDATEEARDLARQKAEAMGEDAAATADAGDAAANAAASQEQLVSELTAGESAATGLEDAIDALSNALDVLNGTQLSANEASRAWEEAIDSAQEALAKNGRTLDVTTEKGRANSAAMDAMAKAAMDNGLAIMSNGGSYADFTKTLETARGSLLTTAKQFGLNDAAAQAYVDSVLAIPAEAQTNVMLQGAKQATFAVDELLSKVTRLTGQTWTTTLVTKNVATGQVSTTQTKMQADGSVLDFYADGGVREDHVAQIAPAGAWRVWAEEETGGEAYIPLGQAKRGRSKSIVEQVVDRFGGQVEWYADGGVRGGDAGTLVSRAMLLSTLTATAGAVDGSRREQALRREAAAAQVAEAAERNLTRARERGAVVLDELDDRQEAALQALKDRHTAAEDAGQDEVERLRKKKNNDAAVAAAQDRLTALKRANDAAEKAFKRAQDDETDAAKAANKKAEAAATEELTRAKDKEKDATEELKDAEDELADARQRAVQLAQRAGDALARRATLGDAASDVTSRKAAARDAVAAQKELDTALADADAAGGTTRGESRASAMERRSSALEALATAGAQWASAQRAMGADAAIVQTGLDQVRDRVEALGAAYGLTGRQIGDLTGALDEQADALPTGEELLGSLNDELERMRQTAKAISALEAAGLNGALVDQLFEKGTDSGLAMAQALLSGGSGLIAQLNATQAGIESTANGFGASLAAGRYAPGRRLEPQPVSLLEGASIALVSDTHVALAANTAVGLISGTSVAIDPPVLAELSQRIAAALATQPLVVKLDGRVLASEVNRVNDAANYRTS